MDSQALEKRLSLDLHSPSSWSPGAAFNRVWALLPHCKRPQAAEGMDPEPICEQARRINFNPTRRGTTCWDWKWWWSSIYVWNDFKSLCILEWSQSRTSWHSHDSTESPASMFNLYWRQQKQGYGSNWMLGTQFKCHCLPQMGTSQDLPLTLVKVPDAKCNCCF